MYILLKWWLEVYDYASAHVVLVENHYLWCEQYSFGFSRFMPWGARVCSVWVHLNSTLWRIAIACGLLRGFLMNFKTVIWMSSFLVWPGLVKCNATSLLGSFFLMSPKWPTNLSIRRSSVWPTFCRPQTWQVMAYNKLELLHDILHRWMDFFSYRAFDCPCFVQVGAIFACSRGTTKREASFVFSARFTHWARDPGGSVWKW